MKVNIINSRHNPKLDDYIRGRLNSVIGRFASRIAHMDVHIRDENAGKGGTDKVCSIDLKLIPRGAIHVSAKNMSVYTASRKAAHRAEKAVVKAIDRRHRCRVIRHNNGGVRHLSDQLASADSEPDVGTLTE